MLTLRFQRVSPTHHKIAYHRSDGSWEEAIVETKSLLLHDFLHFALESEAGLIGGFYGLLAQGYSYGQLAGKEPGDYPMGEAQDVERVVGPLTIVVKEAIPPSVFVREMERLFGAYEEEPPRWLSEEVVRRTQERFKKIMGQWNSLPFGQVLELNFGPSHETQMTSTHVTKKGKRLDDDVENMTSQTL